mgnify:CR=1 FL=1
MSTVTVEISDEEACALGEFRENGYRGLAEYATRSEFSRVVNESFAANQRWSEAERKVERVERDLFALRNWLLLNHGIRMEDAMEEAVKEAFDWMDV